MFYLEELNGPLLEGCFIKNNSYFCIVAGATGSRQNNILCYVVSETYLKIALENDNVTCIILNNELIKANLNFKNKGILVANDPVQTYLKINNFFYENGFLTLDYDFKIAESATIDKSSCIAESVFVGENVKIGRNCIIHGNTIIHDNCIIEDNVTIGNEGLYFKRNSDGYLHRIYSSGGVEIFKDVEVLNGSSIQRSHDLGMLTTIGEGTKVSVNVNVGHASTIGQHTLISGNVQIAGRAKIGNYCWIGTSSTISDSVVIGDRSQVRIGSVVIQNLLDEQDVSGNFAYSHKARLRNYQKLRRGL